MKNKFILINYLSLVLLFIISVTVISCSSSRNVRDTPEGWVLLGDRKVNFVRDVDELKVYNTERFTALLFKVEKRAIRINSLEVYFENGDKLDVNVDADVEVNQFSKIIQLASEGKQIDRIKFKYRTTGNILKGRARVKVYGRNRW